MTTAPSVSSYKLLEEPLLQFMCCRIREMVGQDLGAEREAIVKAEFSKRVDSLDALQHKDLCHLLIKNVQMDKRTGCTLFKRYRVRIAFAADVRYVKDLRDKYAHPTATSLPSTEQLSDLIVIDRVVQALSDQGSDLSKDFLSRIDAEIDRHLKQAAPALAPERYDVEANIVPFPVTWREEISRVLTATMAQALGTASTSETSVSDSGRMTVALEAVEARFQAASAILEEIRNQQRLLTTRQTEIDSRLALMQSFAERLDEKLSVVLVPSGTHQDGEYSDELIGQSENDEGWSEQLWDDDQEEPYSSPLSAKEARDLLIGLRQRIWDELGQGPSSNGLLRKRMLDFLLRCRPLNDRDLEAAIPSDDLRRIPRDQLAYLPQVYDILRRTSG